MTDFTGGITRAVLSRLKNDGGVTGLVPKAQIFSGTVPANPLWPFIKYGAPIATPFCASGLNSSQTDVGIHAFVKPLYDDAGVMLMTAESRASLIANAIASALDGATMEISPGFNARAVWLRSNFFMDAGSTSIWHAVVSINAQVAG